MWLGCPGRWPDARGPTDSSDGGTARSAKQGKPCGTRRDRMRWCRPAGGPSGKQKRQTHCGGRWAEVILICFQRSTKHYLHLFGTLSVVRIVYVQLLLQSLSLGQRFRRCQQSPASTYIHKYDSGVSRAALPVSCLARFSNLKICLTA